MEIKIITGLSGAGKSTVIDKLEDLGYYCIDNLPPSLLTKFFDMIVSSGGGIKKIAIVIDIRGRAFFGDLEDILKNLKKTYSDCEIVFLEAEVNTLVKRFKETRRAHPLSKKGENEGSIVEGIKSEIEMTSFIRDLSDRVIDTTSLSKRELELLLIKAFSHKIPKKSLEIVFNSFGFKNGIPLHADMVFDVRFVENPHYIKELRPLTGEDLEVYDYVFSQKTANEYYEKLYSMLNYCFKAYVEEGRTQLIVSIGCTGGRHRSVAFARKLASEFIKLGYEVQLSHRDINKNSEKYNE